MSASGLPGGGSVAGLAVGVVLAAVFLSQLLSNRRPEIGEGASDRVS